MPFNKIKNFSLIELLEIQKILKERINHQSAIEFNINKSSNRFSRRNRKSSSNSDKDRLKIVENGINEIIDSI